MILASVSGYQRIDGTLCDALRTVVDMVDLCVVATYHGCEHDFADERALCGDKLRVVYIDRVRKDPDVAPSRNQAIEQARRCGADMVLMLDPDERMHWPEGCDSHAMLHEFLEKSPLDCHVIRAQEGFYSKDKFLTPSQGEYFGTSDTTHEAWVPKHPEKRALWYPGPRFSELGKTRAQTERRDIGVIKGLRRAIRKTPKDGRAHFYLGMTYCTFARWDLAIKHFEQCIRNTNWSDEAGFANYRLAQIYVSKGDFDLAVRCCVNALACNATMGEAAWLAGTCRAMQQRVREAVAWSQMAVAVGCYCGTGQSFARVHYLDVVGLWEGPFETLRACYEAIGNREAALESLDHWRKAYAQRIKVDGGPELAPDDWRFHGDQNPVDMEQRAAIDAERAGKAAE